ncbi:tRNA (adenosine(37)-N6)-threonylcarbamoyltransferase complex dimerization subunit type 1 TsaB [Candidatus Dependentiae bacterium]
MNYHLAIQHTYNGIELGLFDGSKPIQVSSDDKKKASKNIVVLVNELLQANDVSFEDLQFIAANQGPGPFTTLRVVIASVNGLAFATKKPLIGVDGLDAVLQEHENPDYEVTVALLNAYSNDIYFGIQDKKRETQKKGYQQILSFLSELKTAYPNQTVRFIGQGVLLYADQINEVFGKQALIPSPVPEHCSVRQIGLMAWEKWDQQKDLAEQLFPMYLKTMRIKKKAPSSF